MTSACSTSIILWLLQPEHGRDCMTAHQNTAWSLRGASSILLLCIVHGLGAVAGDPLPAKLAIAEARDTRLAALTTKVSLPRNRGGRVRDPDAGTNRIHPRSSADWLSNLRFTHLTANDGLSQNHVLAILQDRRGFMWFATEDGLSRYDGNAFVVYKNNRNDPGSIGSNSTKDLQEDDHGYLWVVAAHGGVSKFDPTTERFTRYRHDSSNPNSLSSDSVEDIARDSRGFLWFGTVDSGLDRFDPTTETFTHYRNDSDGKFLGMIHRVIEDSHREIWFVGQRGLFHLNVRTGQITRPPGTIKGLSAGYLYEDSAGNFWMLAWSPIVGLVQYDRKKERCIEYPVGAGAALIGGSKLLNDGENGLWVPSSLGLFYFDLRTERFTYHFRHDETNPDSLNDNAVVQAYRDRAGLLWVATEHGGLNVLNSQQELFGRLKHRPGDPNSLSPGRVTAIYLDSDNVLWLGFFPRALDRLDRKTGRITHYVPDLKNRNALSKGDELSSICEDARGYLWLGGWRAGLDRYDKRAGQFKHYGHNPSDPASLMSDNVLNVYEDRNSHLWVGQTGGVSRFDAATQRFVNYRTGPDTLYNTVSAIHQDRSGMLWLGKWDGVVSRLDTKTGTLVNYTPDSRDPHKLQGGSISVIYEDRAGTLWVGTETGVCRYNRQNEIFTCYAESPDMSSVSNSISGLLEDGDGRLWLSTKNGMSRFNPKTETFRHYDTSDGLQSNEFRDRAFAQGPDGEMFFGGNNGITTFFPENIRDNPYVPPIVVTSFKMFNKPVPIGAKSILKKSISDVDALTLSYRDAVFSFEFAALSYANSKKNRYRYKLEGLEPSWNEVGSQQRLATYTNLNPGKYVFRVQGSNSDGIWNEQGVSLPILITPPWWETSSFRALCVAAFVSLLWALYQYRLHQLARQFNMRLEERVGERTRIARDLHDTLLQSFHGVLLFLQSGIHLMREHPSEGMKTLETAVEQAERAIIEGREAVQGLRASTVERNDLALAIKTLGGELGAADGNSQRPEFSVQVEGTARNLHPILRDEVYRITGEAMRNAFRHSDAKQIEVEIRYDERQIRLRVRDDGKGINPKFLSDDGREGHFGLRGMRERAKLIGGKLTVWSELDSGTEVELSIPASRAYTATAEQRSWLAEKFAKFSGKDTELKS
jgi:ligand-binding sensor domain-containing protein/signal transduction histidine kinase